MGAAPQAPVAQARQAHGQEQAHGQRPTSQHEYWAQIAVESSNRAGVEGRADATSHLRTQQLAALEQQRQQQEQDAQLWAQYCSGPPTRGDQASVRWPRKLKGRTPRSSLGVESMPMVVSEEQPGMAAPTETIALTVAAQVMSYAPQPAAVTPMPEAGGAVAMWALLKESISDVVDLRPD